MTETVGEAVLAERDEATQKVRPEMERQVK
jgi:hypothetical protein